MTTYRGSFPETRDLGTRVGMSPDGALLVGFLALILLGPYLPLLRIFDNFGIGVGASEQGARLDNIAVPLFAAYILARAAVGRGLRIPVHTAWYLAFLVWLGLMTVIWWSRLPDEYAGESARGIGLIKSVEAYVRPLMILVIVANLRVNRHDLRIVVRLILGVAVVMALIAAAQLLPVTAGTVNPFLARYYDNSIDDVLFWRTLDGGRVSALMPQLSTLGMYMVMAVGLVGMQLISSRSMSRTVTLAFILGAVVVGGALSGSKVFVGGVALFLILGVIGLRVVPRISLARLATILLVAALLWVAMARVFPDSTDRIVSRINPSDGDLYGQYLSSRFDPEEGKLFRNGAVDIARDYPLTGLGLNVVNRTTDSMLLGIVIMGGIVGLTLYLLVIVSVLEALWRVVISDCAEDLKSLARTLILLTIVFAIIAGAFHTLIQDRAGDAYWILVGLVAGPIWAQAKVSSSGSVPPENTREVRDGRSRMARAK